MLFCHICDKPFTKESSHKRHISYCRRNQTRLRTRPRSCRACNAAKVKCTFQVPCRRCTAKGLDCIYDFSASGAVAAAEDGDTAPSSNEQTAIDLSDQAASVQDTNLSNVDISVEGDSRVLDEFDLLQSAGNMNDVFSELQRDDTFAHGYEEIPDIISATAQSPANRENQLDTWLSPYTSIQPRMSLAAQAPWSAWTTSVANHPDLHTPNLNEFSSNLRRGCLGLLRPSSRIIQHNTHLLVQALRAYPLMMLRRETLPPFIHPYWHRKSTPALPEPLSNCMSIAQMYAFRSDETKAFLWRTVKAEDERFLAQRTNFSPQDMLAAIQAQIIYIIMRVVDGQSEPLGLNQQLVKTYQFLCKQFMNGCSTPFCEVDQFWPRPSWEDWIFAESRRRTACLFFLICGCVSVDTGSGRCDAFDWLRELPLASPKTLWEAKTRAEWESEYSAYSSLQETGIHTMGMLIEAHKRSDDPAKSQLLDYWNVRADNLGNLLNTAASLAEYR